MGQVLFRDRQEAAERLARRLVEHRWPAPRVVLALPRGGVPIGAVLAQRLGAAFDLLLVRKIGAPWQPELAIGALVDGDEPLLVINQPMAERTGADAAYLDEERRAAWQEIERRRALYLGDRASASLRGATVVVCDDGIATGTTMRAAVRAVAARGAARCVVAVPVASHEALLALRNEVDELICLAEPVPFRSVGEHYADYHQVPDDEVIAALKTVPSPPVLARDAPTSIR